MNFKVFVAIIIFLPIILIAGEKENLMKFTSTEANLGEVSIKNNKTVVFYYTNNSNKPLVILETKTFCGCTKVKYNRKPILSQVKDSIIITFKPDEKGAFYKKVNIKNSLGEKQTLVLKGSVK